MINRAFNVGLMLSLAFMLVMPAYAQEDKQYDDHVLSDGELTKRELAIVLLRAKHDLTSLLEKAVSEIQLDVENAGVFSPRAWMLMKDLGLKEVKLSGQAKEAPADIKVRVFRASLRSVARHNQIDAALIAYPGSINKDGEVQHVVAVEHEHRLGVSGIKLIPLTLENGEASFGSPMSQNKPFDFFYDEKGSNPARAN